MACAIRTIETGELTPIDDGPGAVAPSLKPEAIADALSWAINHWPTLHQRAQDASDDWYQHWSWPNVLKNWIQQL
jgi:hypothetical protein